MNSRGVEQFKQLPVNLKLNRYTRRTLKETLLEKIGQRLECPTLVGKSWHTQCAADKH